MATEVFARDIVQPDLQPLFQSYDQNMSTLKSCMKGLPGEAPGISCMQSYRYITEICLKEKTLKLDRKYYKGTHPYFLAACYMFNETSERVVALLDVDRKNCAPGFETVADTFMTVSKNSDLLDAPEVFRFSAVSCRSYTKYLNLCAYVDGDLKTVMPKTFEKLPPVNYKAEGNCKSPHPEYRGLDEIDHDLAELAKPGLGENYYEKLITQYRSRKPASQHSLPMCDNLRMAYKNMNCNIYEDEKNFPKKIEPGKKDGNDQTVTDTGTRDGNF